MKILKAKTPVFLNGVILEPGSKFSCSDELAEKYIESKAATVYTEKKTKEKNTEDSTS